MFSSIARVSASIPPGHRSVRARRVADLAGQEHESVGLDDLREREGSRLEPGAGSGRSSASWRLLVTLIGGGLAAARASRESSPSSRRGRSDAVAFGSHGCPHDDRSDEGIRPRRVARPPARVARRRRGPRARGPHDRASTKARSSASSGRTARASRRRSGCCSASSTRRRLGDRARARHRPRQRRDPRPGRLPARRDRPVRLADRRAAARLPRRADRPAVDPPGGAARPARAVGADARAARSATTRAGCARRSGSSRPSSTIRSWRSSTSRPRASTR